MVKFSNELREKIVLDYLSGGGGFKFLAKKYGIGSHKTIFEWVNRYKKYGGSALDIRSPKNAYDGNFKLEVLKWMKTNRASLTETALQFNISTTSTILSWERKYEEEGVEALFRRRGRPEQMTNSLDHQHNQRKNGELSEIEKLKQENRLLRIEIEYLKKLKALMREPDNTDKSNRK